MENQEFRSQMLERAKETVTSPGCYLMRDEASTVIYVGKARNLRSRLLQYFQPDVQEHPRTEMMVGRVRRFDVILTETEAEALILEATLIKKHKPKFNVRLKDDKTYPYLRIDQGVSFPRIEWTRKVRRDGSRYFGPFPSSGAARKVLKLLNETFQLRDCSDNTFRHRSRPCILHQMGQCSAPCVGLITPQAYREVIQEVIGVLEGRGDKLLKELRKGMEDAAAEDEFELAAEYRDQLQALELVTATQVVAEPGSVRSRDVASVARHGSEGHGVMLQLREGKLVAVRHYHLQNLDESLPEPEVLKDFLAQFYLEASDEGSELARASEVLLAEPPADLELLERTLGVSVRVAESASDRQLLNVALANARHGLEQASRKEQGHGLKALEDILDKLHLQRLPQRIECYDISNFQGTDSVASRVVFVDGAPDKNLYRRYKIKTVEGSNDFASMREVLGRRFANDESLPDLVVVDGGKGQLAQAVAILEELGVQGVGVVGLAKARTESDFQATEVKGSHERIFIPNRKNPVPLLPHTEAYKLLTHIRDEAHRFAVSYHRAVRSKRILGGDRD